MTKKLILTIFAFSFSVALFAEKKPELKKDKSIAAGVLLGTIGILGIPGTFGWGNFYAKDYAGFAVLNIGGSACTLTTWAILLSSISTTNGVFYAKPVPAIIGVTMLGSVAFSVCSIILGGTSVDRFNLLQKIKEEKSSFSIFPVEGGFAVTYSTKY